LSTSDSSPRGSLRLWALDQTLPLLHTSIALAAGSSADPDGREGTTRLLLRMMRRTAGGRTARISDELLEGLGSGLTGEVGRSVAALHGTVIERNAAPFLDFLADAIARPKFDQEELGRLRAEALADLDELLDDDAALVRRAFDHRFYRGHAWARPSAGTRTSLRSIQADDLERHHERLIRSGSLRCAFAGSGEQAKLDAFVDALDATLRGPVADDRIPLTVASQATALPEPTPEAGRVLHFVDKPERTQTQILMGCLGAHPKDEDHAALHVAHTIFGGTFGARLSQEVRAKRGWSYGAYSALPVDRLRQPMTMWTFPKAEDAAACVRLVLDLFEALIERGVTKREVALARKYLKNSHVFAIDTPAKRVGLALDAEIFGLPRNHHEEFLERALAADKDIIDDAIRRRFSAERLLVTVVGTHAEIGLALEKAIPRLSQSEVVPFDQDI
jgi:zinc protease